MMIVHCRIPPNLSCMLVKEGAEEVLVKKDEDYELLIIYKIFKGETLVKPS